jgi:hypothetical protein
VVAVDSPFVGDGTNDVQAMVPSGVDHSLVPRAAVVLDFDPCLDYAISNRIAYGIWGGLTERERRALRSGWVRAARRERDRAVLAAEAAGYTATAIGRSFGLSRTPATRIVRTGNDATQPGWAAALVIRCACGRRSSTPGTT